jgi:hypothetical protein
MKLWTYIISGSGSFTITVKNHPPIIYKGSINIWKGWLKESDACLLLKAIKDQGVNVSMICQEKDNEYVY